MLVGGPAYSFAVLRLAGTVEEGPALCFLQLLGWRACERTVLHISLRLLRSQEQEREVLRFQMQLLDPQS